MRFTVLVVVNIKIIVFLGVVPGSLVQRQACFF